MVRTTLAAAILVLSATAATAQDNYQDWATAGSPTLPGVPSSAAPDNVRGTATVFTDRVAFDAAAGVLPLEDFDGGATAPGAVNTCSEPVSSASNDVCFAPGDLIDGFQITSSSGGGIVVLGDGFLPQPSAVVGANTFGDITSVAFTEADVNAVALDAYSGSGGSLDVEIRVFDSGGVLADTVTVTTSANNVSEFFGILAPGPISRVEIEALGGGGELIDNLAFGAGGVVLPPESVPVPALSTVGLIIAAMMLLLLAGFVLRARSNR
jgi:hypothetical protein